jgi:hypothetical protein
MMISCINHYSKKHPRSSIKIKDNLFYEVYFTSGGGVFATDTYSKYLTDSTTFRKFVGYQCDDENLWFSVIDNDRVLVYKIEIHTRDTLERKMYIISQLKKEGKFE